METLRAFLRFLGVILLGMDDGNKAFSESLEMAERYLRWGRERNDPRDYEAALENALRCRDDNTPKPDMLIRKYNSICESHLGLMRIEVARYIGETKSMSGEKDSLNGEITSVRKALDDSRKVVADLQEEGSIIKAREEELHTTELERKLERLLDRQSSGALDNELASDYQKLVAENMQHRAQVEQAIARMQMIEDVDPQIRDSYVNAVLGSLQAQTQDLQNVAPGASGV